MEWIAHRAGNAPELVTPALRATDAVETDVHLFRGRLEVRHSKVLRPFRIYWERGVGIVGDERPPDFASILGAVPDDAHLWVDLKGFTRRLRRRVERALAGRPDVTMSSRSWWILPSPGPDGARTFRSAGSRWQIWLAVRMRHPDGVGTHERHATPERIERLRTRCSAIAVWGVHDVERAVELHDLGVQVLIVDDLDLIDAFRRRRPA